MFPYYCEKNTGTTVLPNNEAAATDNCINRTAVSVPYYCESTGTIVRASVRSLPETTAGTGATTAVLTAASLLGRLFFQVPDLLCRQLPEQNSSYFLLSE